MSAPSRHDVPRVGPGFRLQWEAAQDCHVLLYPEGMVKLNGSAGEIMARCDGRARQAIVAELETCVRRDGAEATCSPSSTWPAAALVAGVAVAMPAGHGQARAAAVAAGRATYRCPLHCVFCYNPVDFARHEDELSTEDWLRVLREARALGAVQLGLSGGEPLVRDDLEADRRRGASPRLLHQPADLRRRPHRGSARAR